MRVLHRDDGLVRLTHQGWAAVDPARQVIAADVAERRRRAAVVRRRDRRRRTADVEAVRPGHVAVLVSRNRDAATVRDALDAVGVPAVINGAGSVFGTPIARDWRALLEALERPSSSGRVHAVALTVFVGWSAERVATADEAAWEEVYDDVHRWAELLRRRGVAALLESITHAERLPGARARRVSTASAGSPICATSASCSTPRRWPASSASPPWRRGCAAASPRRSRTSPTRTAAGGWSRTARRCRC